MTDKPRHTASRLTRMKIREVSLVDHPASPGAVVILAKNGAGSPEPGGAIPDLILKSASGVLTEEDLLIAVTKGDATVEEIIKAMEDGEITKYTESPDPYLVEKVWARYGDHRSQEEKWAAFDRAFITALNDPPRPREKLEGFLKRHDARFLPALERAVFTGAFSMHKRSESLVRKAVHRLDEIAKSIAAERGLSYAQGFAAACRENGDLYQATKALGGFAYGAGEGPENHADGSDDYEGEDEDAPPDGSGNDATSRAMRAYYEPDDVSEEAASGTRAYDADGGADSAVDHFNEGDADSDLLLIRRTADKLQEDAVTGASRNLRRPLSRPAAIAKAWQAHPEAYARLKRRGKLGDCK